ncbi:MAG: alpha-1,2-fucosyltransferase [Bacteroidales bacterium]|jgi:hypothetical protein|nr:alpha-1,2-fucosyltransferase [Bacteroidales bacterium]
MIVIRLRSGLGNQMFQYAFFLQMQQWYGKDKVKLDIDTFHWKAHNGRELDKVFGIDLAQDAIPAAVSLKMADVGYDIKSKVLRRLRGSKHKHYLFWKQLQYENYRHLPEHVYLEGYWNEEIYFRDVAGKVRSIYRFPQPQDSANRKLLRTVEAMVSVGVHVRRGDYIRYPDILPMCSAAYYRQAAQIIRTKTRDEPHFYVFSDDPEWCRNNINLDGDTVFVDINAGKDAWKDMMLMSHCRHQIIANSTFSWWAAWLNPNAGKIVIYPSSTTKTYASMPDAWLMLHVD